MGERPLDASGLAHDERPGREPEHEGGEGAPSGGAKPPLLLYPLPGPGASREEIDEWASRVIDDARERLHRGPEE